MSCSSGPAPSTALQLPAASRLVTRRRSEEHTSELQSQSNLVCRLLLEKKKKLRHHFIPPFLPPCLTTHLSRPASTRPAAEQRVPGHPALRAHLRCLFLIVRLLLDACRP